MSLESILSGFGGMVGTAVMNKKNAKAAEKNRKQGIDMIKSMDWEPMYASETVPTYQRTQSPVARSYLESFLMGNNPNATFSGAPNAKLTKERQQAAQNQMFGTPEQRVAQQRAYEATTPWKVQTPTRPVIGQQGQDALHKAGNPTAAMDLGVDRHTYDKLVREGFIPEGTDLTQLKGFNQTYGTALTKALRVGDDEAVKDLLTPYKMDRPHAVARNRQKRKRAKEIGRIVDRYAPDEED